MSSSVSIHLSEETQFSAEAMVLKLLSTVAMSQKSKSATAENGSRSEFLLHQQAQPIQKFGTVRQKLPIALPEDVRVKSVENLNQVLVDTMSLRDLYKKHHWQLTGPTFYQLHLLFDKHYEEQSNLVDELAERIQALGGIAYAMAPDVAENTRIPRPPKDREEAPVQISRLLEAHEIVLGECREYAKAASDSGDDGTNDLLVSDLIRTNEAQVWFISEHVVDVPLARAD
jgi:starvation-inducible DNA-binding protein